VEGCLNTVVTQQLQGLPTLASSGVMIDCKSVHFSSILSRCDVIWMSKLRMPYLYHQSVILAHYEAEKRSYGTYQNGTYPRIQALNHKVRLCLLLILAHKLFPEFPNTCVRNVVEITPYI
jgi:hypothetical protein